MLYFNISLKISIIWLIFAQHTAAWTKEFQDTVREIEPSQFGDDGMALGSFHYIDENEKFVLEVQTYTSSGEITKSCKRRLDGGLIRWTNGDALKMTHLGEQNLLLSWNYGKKFPSTNSRGYSLELFVLDTADCSWHNRSIENRCTDYRSCNKDYSTIITGENQFDVLVYNADVCGSGICKFSIDSFDHQIEIMNGKKFMDGQGRQNTNWMIEPIDSNDLSKGYYYCSYNTMTGTVKLMSLDSNGAILHSKSQNYTPYPGPTIFSVTYGYVSFCNKLHDPNISIKLYECKQYDSSLNEILTTNFKLDHRGLITHIVNAKNGGLLLYTLASPYCGPIGACIERSLEIIKVEPDGNFGDKIEVLRVNDDYEIDDFRAFVNEREDILCYTVKILGKGLLRNTLPQIRMECNESLLSV